MEAEVFAAYETTISIDEQVEIIDTFTTSGEDYVIDNSGNSNEFPFITITANEALTLTSINNNNIQQVDIGLSLSSGDIVEFDFGNQEYKLNSSSIIDDLTFTDNSRIFLEADKENILSFSVNGSIDVEIKYDNYEKGLREAYVRNFSITIDDSYSDLKPFNKNKLINKKKEETIYNLSMSRLSVDWHLYENVDSNNIYRITYIEDHTSTYEYFEKYLVGVTFESFRKGFNNNDGLIITDVSGEGMNLL